LIQRFVDADGMPKLLRLLEAVLLVLLAIQTARLLWLLLPAAPVGESGQATPGSAPALPRTDLFYRSDAHAVAAADSGGYSLRGVRMDARGGSAILADAAGKQQSWAVGETLAPGLTLAQVGPDHVQLRGPGGLQRLELPAPSGVAAAGAVPPTAQPAGTSAASTAIDPAALIAQAGLSQDEAGSYSIHPRGDGALLRAAGLQAGDVVLDINGATLNAENIAAAQSEFAPGEPLTVRIRRDGRIRILTVPAIAAAQPR
jgi:general secretion pathway protein C